LPQGRGGSGLIFSGSGQAWVEAFGPGFFALLKFKIGLEAFKSRALIMGLKIRKNYKILLHKSTKKNFQALQA
jgi:hypothetical protein